jgi:hypothetical protein
VRGAAVLAATLATTCFFLALFSQNVTSWLWANGLGWFAPAFNATLLIYGMLVLFVASLILGVLPVSPDEENG